MAGIYIHIPFCRKACNYCNFHFSTSQKLQVPFLAALKTEMRLQKDYLAQDVNTVYFGGGTPSILQTSEVEELIHTLRENFAIADAVEFTLEANPDDITAEKLQGWKDAGINRLSIGVQSFVEDDLRWMNRAHNVTQAIESIQLAQAAGFHNLTVDLIYGTPTLSDEQWERNVEQVIALKIPHLSCYALTVEPKTALEKLIQKNQLAPVDNNKQAHHFELLMQWLADAGYEHYEISNFAKPGFRSKHNSSYWQGSHYLGMGPSAHSFNGKSRQWNVANNALYIKNLEQDQLPFEREVLTTSQQANEYIMTGLRTIEGISITTLEERFGGATTQHILQAAQGFISKHQLQLEDGWLKTTPAGKLLADGIASDLFVD